MSKKDLNYFFSNLVITFSGVRFRMRKFGLVGVFLITGLLASYPRVSYSQTNNEAKKKAQTCYDEVQPFVEELTNNVPPDETPESLAKVNVGKINESVTKLQGDFNQNCKNITNAGANWEKEISLFEFQITNIRSLSQEAKNQLDEIIKKNKQNNPNYQPTEDNEINNTKISLIPFIISDISSLQSQLSKLEKAAATIPNESSSSDSALSLDTILKLALILTIILVDAFLILIAIQFIKFGNKESIVERQLKIAMENFWQGKVNEIRISLKELSEDSDDSLEKLINTQLKNLKEKKIKTWLKEKETIINQKITKIMDEYVKNKVTEVETLLKKILDDSEEDFIKDSFDSIYQLLKELIQTKNNDEIIRNLPNTIKDTIKESYTSFKEEIDKKIEERIKTEFESFNSKFENFNSEFENFNSKFEFPGEKIIISEARNPTQESYSEPPKPLRGESFSEESLSSLIDAKLKPFQESVENVSEKLNNIESKLRELLKDTLENYLENYLEKKFNEIKTKKSTDNNIETENNPANDLDDSTQEELSQWVKSLIKAYNNQSQEFSSYYSEKVVSVTQERENLGRVRKDGITKIIFEKNAKGIYWVINEPDTENYYVVIKTEKDTITEKTLPNIKDIFKCKSADSENINKYKLIKPAKLIKQDDGKFVLEDSKYKGEYVFY